MLNLAKSLARSRSIFKLLNEKQSRNILFNSKFFHTKPKVLITRAGLPGEMICKVKEECETDINEKHLPMTKEELIGRIRGVDGVCCSITDGMDKDVISAAGDRLKIISTTSAGFDHIDLAECKKRNILVSHTPHVNANAVAEWTVTLMLCAGRRFVEAAAAAKKGEWATHGKWDPEWLCGIGLEDSVVGIVGMGRIGQAIMKRVFPFGVKRVLYNDLRPIMPAEEIGGIYAKFGELVKESDFILPMCNLTDKTRGLFNKRVFDLMKPTAIFINTSRGEVVNQEDLYNALQYKIRGAAIDVTIPEPLPSYHKLNSLPNLIITPHVAASRMDVIIKMVNLAAENLLLGLREKPLLTPVPMSDIALSSSM